MYLEWGIGEQNEGNDGNAWNQGGHTENQGGNAGNGGGNAGNLGGILLFKKVAILKWARGEVPTPQ